MLVVQLMIHLATRCHISSIATARQYDKTENKAPEGYLTSTIMNFYIRYLKQQVSPTISDYHFFQHIFLQETQRSCFLQWLVPNRFPRSSLTTQACLLITLWLQLKITHQVLEMRELTMGASRITMLLQRFIPYPVAPCHCFACSIPLPNLPNQQKK